MPTRVEFPSKGITLVADLYLPLHQTLKASDKARIAEAKGEPGAMQPRMPDSVDKVPDTVPIPVKEGCEYYRTPRGQHPRSINSWPVRVPNYSPYTFIDLISPRPLLMIAGSEADTRFFSEEAIARAKDPKK
ncbi:hypothetical protein ASPWEDRAFT_172142 [Aspergillus wentii DTO 134E9]|uniref:Uncharacterized protein n=1 Tax=Aspergillus wentii DTO 134E9 TaxID=1073089 RepID=A0A1L9RKF7_ASPWE|nr:uncharacterized protein ASPWEDRAFT_172142 [Aspergillus wentii DTO 134E9]KAI9924898.1 hypothetical protein MW887_006756 [Aspergillus wentii]OJJ35328.1 hypothetical protein ASPWEDRAFT_172142 [Aspergillus wentii DTO 134E9]